MCPGHYIPLSELQAYTKKAVEEKLVDQQVRDIDIGKAHVGIGMVHRGKLDKPAPNSVAEHDLVSEVYHIIDGTATLVLGPDIHEPAAAARRRQLTVREFNGPGNNGSDIRNGRTLRPQAGDVVVIPAGTGHWFTKIDDHIDYLMVRIDPDKVTPIKDEAASKAYLSKPAAARKLDPELTWCPEACRILAMTGRQPRHHESGQASSSASASSTSRLYSLATQIVGGVILTPWFSFPALGTSWPMRDDHRVARRARLRSAPAARLHRQQRRHRVPLDSERLAAGAGHRSSPPPGSTLQPRRDRERTLAHVVPRVHPLRAGRADVLLRNGEDHPDAVPAAVARDAGRIGRQPLALRSALDAGRRLHAVPDLHRLRGDAVRDPAALSTDDDARCADRRGGHDCRCSC